MTVLTHIDDDDDVSSEQVQYCCQWLVANTPTDLCTLCFLAIYLQGLLAGPFA